MSEQNPPSGDYPATPSGSGDAPPPPPYGAPPPSEPYAPPPTPPAAPAQPADPYGAPPAPGSQPPAYGQPAQPYAPPAQPYAPPAQPYGQPAQPYGQPTPYGATPAAGFPFTGTDPDKRPGTVTAACIVAFVLSGLALVGMLIIVLAASSQEFTDALRDSEQFDTSTVTVEQLASYLRIGGSLLAAWSAVAIGLAIWAMRRSNVGRILLVISAALAAVVGLFSLFTGALLAGLWAAGSIASIVLLFTGGANDWYARRGSTAGGYPAPPGW